jgi:hypothetical protein
MTGGDDGTPDRPRTVAGVAEVSQTPEGSRGRTRNAANRARKAVRPVKPVPDPQALPPTFPVQTASRVLGIGRNRTYESIKSGDYPVRVIESGGRYRVSRWDLLKYLGATG